MKHQVTIKTSILSIILAISFCFGSAQASTSSIPGTITATLSGQVDISIEVYPARGDNLILWIASGNSFKQRHHDLANNLSKLGIEVWLADIRDALFLPEGSTSIRKLDGQYTAKLIELAGIQSNKNIILMGNYSGSIPVLRGAHKWQEKENRKARFKGAILFSPNVFSSIPALGTDPEYLPIVKATNIPVMIYMGSRHGRRWHLQSLVETLRQGGSTVYFEIMKDANSLLYEEDNTKGTLKYLELIPGKIKKTINLLVKTPMPSKPVPLQETITTRKPGDIELKSYQGNPVPRPITLVDINGKLVKLNNYTGKVTAINFWATWCPPCVEEIPSLNRLRKAMENEEFELVSINFSEEKDTVRKFLDKVHVDFPVLLDHDGVVSSQWKVIAFPSTFIIGPDGKIHYGVNAAIYWDSPEVIKTLKQLANIPR
jgi:thiol-disulfide isomerase/thioredoxin